MFLEIDDWRRSLSPVEECWQWMKYLRAAKIRRDIAADLPLCLVPTIGAYLANEYETTRTHIGAVTIPIPTKHIKTTTHTPEGEPS